jgi:hypothetical protein
VTSRIRIPRQLTSLARVVLVSETVLIAVRACMLLLSCIFMATRFSSSSSSSSQWRYYTSCLTACSTVLFHSSLSIAILLQFQILIFPTAPLTPSSYLYLWLPILLTAIGLHSFIIFTVLSLSILTICPNPSHSLCLYTPTHI